MPDEAAIDPPVVPENRLADGDWRLTDRQVDRLVALGAANVRGHTVVYEDDRLRRRIREATGGAHDRMWRFFFATRLAFTPPLPPGIGPAMVFGPVSSGAADSFVDRLADHGFEEVTDRGRERIRVDTGERANVRRYGARLSLDGLELDVAGWLAVWVHDGFRLAGGAYPETPLATVLETAADSFPGDRDAYRAELLDLIRAVE